MNESDCHHLALSFLGSVIIMTSFGHLYSVSLLRHDCPMLFVFYLCMSYYLRKKSTKSLVNEYKGLKVYKCTQICVPLLCKKKHIFWAKKVATLLKKQTAFAQSIINPQTGGWRKNYCNCTPQINPCSCLFHTLRFFFPVLPCWTGQLIFMSAVGEKFASHQPWVEICSSDAGM